MVLIIPSKRTLDAETRLSFDQALGMIFDKLGGVIESTGETLHFAGHALCFERTVDDVVDVDFALPALRNAQSSGDCGQVFRFYCMQHTVMNDV